MRKIIYSITISFLIVLPFLPVILLLVFYGLPSDFLSEGFGLQIIGEFAVGAIILVLIPWLLAYRVGFLYQDKSNEINSNQLSKFNGKLYSRTILAVFGSFYLYLTMLFWMLAIGERLRQDNIQVVIFGATTFFWLLFIACCFWPVSKEIRR